MLEYLPYEEGIKTSEIFSLGELPRWLEYLPYEEGITTRKGDRPVAPTFSLPLK